MIETEINYIELPKQFRKWGFDWSFINRSGNLALYKQGEHHYNVFIIQKYPDREINGNKIPAKEAVPPENSWGSKAWTFNCLEAARSKFKEKLGHQVEGCLEHCDC